MTLWSNMGFVCIPIPIIPSVCLSPVVKPNFILSVGSNYSIVPMKVTVHKIQYCCMIAFELVSLCCLIQM